MQKGIEMDEKVNEAKEVTAQEEQTENAIVSNTTTNLTFNEFSWMDVQTVGKVYKVAKILAESPLVPENYKNRPASVMLAMEMASTMKMNLMTVMQHLYVVQGRPSWSGAFCITAINGCGKFKPLKFMWMHDAEGNVTGCSASAVRIDDGEVCQGAPVTWETVTGFGWNEKKGSMWNIPGQREQMYQYRSAAYFARTFCPEVLNGLYTVEENQDITGNYGNQQTVVVTADGNNS